MSSGRTIRWGKAAQRACAAGLGAVVVTCACATAAVAAPAGYAPPAPQPWLFHGLWGDSAADQTSVGASGQYQASLDPGSLATVTGAIGARTLWSQNDQTGRPITGAGVGVALLDSGVARVPGLDGAGKVENGPDLSLETNSPDLQNLDDFGHGTFMASLIAAHDPTSGAAQQLGVAPDATLVSLKLATADGSSDVSEIIAGLDWVTQHARDNGNNIRVVNLSFGTDSVQPYQLDPLAAAAENAWRHGIVVVVSGGNEGAVGRLTDPAVDPYVLAVGAADPNGSVAGWSRPSVASFSSVGNSTRHVDLIAPGTSLTGLRDPGSFVDVNNPQGLVTGDASGRLFRGSGTSEAAAVVSGAVALLEQEDPAITPDQVKAALTSTATSLPGVSPLAQGAGEINLQGAARAVRTLMYAPSFVRSLLPAGQVQTFAPATGLGSLEAARGGSNLVDPVNGAVLQGETDVQGQPWVPAVWSPASAAGTAWSGGVWNGATWSGNGWSGTDWTSSAWTGARWSGVAWSSADWDGARWSGARWSGGTWDGARWSGARWSGARWSGSAWS